MYVVVPGRSSWAAESTTCTRTGRSWRSRPDIASPKPRGCLLIGAVPINGNLWQHDGHFPYIFYTKRRWVVPGMHSLLGCISGSKFRNILKYVSSIIIVALILDIPLLFAKSSLGCTFRMIIRRYSLAKTHGNQPRPPTTPAYPISDLVLGGYSWQPEALRLPWVLGRKSTEKGFWSMKSGKISWSLYFFSYRYCCLSSARFQAS